jgi:hypothetical protein
MIKILNLKKNLVIKKKDQEGGGLINFKMLFPCNVFPPQIYQDE